MQTTDIAQASSGALTAPRGLSGTALKFLALGLMVLDHIHYFFGFTGAVPLLFTQLGRLAAPGITLPRCAPRLPRPTRMRKPSPRSMPPRFWPSAPP